MASTRYLLAPFLVALGAAAPAWALDPGALSFAYTGTGARVSAGAITGTAAGRTFTSLANGAVTIADSSAAKIGTATATMAFARVLPYASLLTAAARVLPYLAVASTAYQIYDSVRCKVDTSGGTSGLLCDTGAVKTQQMIFTYVSPQGANVDGTTSLSGTCQLYVAAQQAFHGSTDTPSYVSTYSLEGTSGAYECSVRVITKDNTVNPPTTRQNYVTTVSMGTANKLACTAVPNGTAYQGSSLDGKCPTGHYDSKTPEQAEALAQPYSPTTNGPQMAQEVAQYVDLAPLAQPAPQPLTGPNTVTGTPTIVTTTPPPTQAQPNPQPVATPTYPVYNIHYDGDTYNYTTTTTTTQPDGTKVATETPPDVKNCGLPGQPPCKIDETGTPVYSPTTDTTPTTLPTLDTQRRNDAIASVQAPTFGFIGAPPLAECSPFQLPNNMGALDPCGVVNDVRGVMAYLWALAAAWVCLGWIRQTVAA